MVRNTLNIVKELIDAFLGFRKNDTSSLAERVKLRDYLKLAVSGEVRGCLTESTLNGKMIPIKYHEGVASVYRSKSTY